jgi:hypothetical protein
MRSISYPSQPPEFSCPFFAISRRPSAGTMGSQAYDSFINEVIGPLILVLSIERSDMISTVSSFFEFEEPNKRQSFAIHAAAMDQISNNEMKGLSFLGPVQIQLYL